MFNPSILRAMLVATTLAAARAAFAQATLPAGLSAAQASAWIAPYLDDDTQCIAHLDAARLDTASLEKTFSALFDNLKFPPDSPERAGLAMARTLGDTFLARFKQVGGRHVFLVMNQSDVYPSLSGPAFLFKLEPGADLKALTALIQATFPELRVSPAVADALIACAVTTAPDGAQPPESPTLKRLQSIKPQARPDLAFQDSAAVLEWVVAFTANQRRVFADFPITLPPEVGGGTLEPVIAGVQATSVRFQLPLDLTIALSMTGTTAAASQESAQHVRAAVDKFRDGLLAHFDADHPLDEVPELKPAAPQIRALAAALMTPETVPSGAGRPSLQFHLTERQLQQVATFVMPGLQRARESAERAQSQYQIHRILLACLDYASQHKNTLPDSLDVLVKSNLLRADEILNPADPRRPYVYRRWTPQSSDTTLPLVWEQTDDPTQPLNIGFADGHVEFFQHRSATDPLFKKAADLAAKQPPNAPAN